MKLNRKLSQLCWLGDKHCVLDNTLGPQKLSSCA